MQDDDHLARGGPADAGKCGDVDPLIEQAVLECVQAMATTTGASWGHAPASGSSRLPGAVRSARWKTNQSRASLAASARVPGSSNR